MACFVDSSDYLVYLALLRQLIGGQRCAIHAYCLMTNHVHLLLTAGEEFLLPRVMHGLGQRYAYYFNRKYRRTGTLWEGRFKSCIVDSSNYVLACYRYIEMNPVRAGMVSRPEEYPWSSSKGNTGELRDPLLTPHAEYAALGAGRYAELCESSLSDELLREIREAAISGLPLGGEDFKSRLVESGLARTRKRKAGRPKRSEPCFDEKSVAVPDF